MNLRATRLLSTLAFILFAFLSGPSVVAQDSDATLSGVVADASGAGLPNVQVSVKNVTTGHVVQAQTDSSGHYSVPNLAVGDYEISASPDGYSPGTTKVTLPVEQTVNLTLTAAAQRPGGSSNASPNAAQQAPAQNLPNAPTPQEPSSNAPSLSDLGFTPAESQANAREQALLDKRTHMLKIHQRMGLITTIPMIASVVTSLNAGGKSEGTASRDLHVALGALTGDLYGITAYYAIRAPRIKGTKKRGPIKFHEAMAWIHGPGMIATPILGAMAFSQKNNGEKVHGIAQAHGPVAIVTAGAFGAALVAVSFKF
jgi:hypothetical protein